MTLATDHSCGWSKRSSATFASRALAGGWPLLPLYTIRKASLANQILLTRHDLTRRLFYRVFNCLEVLGRHDVFAGVLGDHCFILAFSLRAYGLDDWSLYRCC